MGRKKKDQQSNTTTQSKSLFKRRFFRKIFIMVFIVVPVGWLLQKYFFDTNSSFDVETSKELLELEQSYSVDTRRKFKGETLIFVTPWNKEGYLYTVEYANKIDYVSPVWYNIKFGQRGLEIIGDQDVDTLYIESLKYANPKLKVIPRIYVDFESKEQFMMTNHTALIRMVADISQSYDGILFDTPLVSYQQLIGVPMTQFLRKLKDNLPKGKLLFSSVMGFNPQMKWTRAAIRDLVFTVDKLLVQLYDYPGQMKEHRPLSPAMWVDENIDYFKPLRQKILMGIPFYGFRVNKQTQQANHVMSKDIHDDLKIEWNEDILECVWKQNDGTFYTYPCNRFIRVRLNAFQANEMGAFVWEGGQGFKQFYEEF